VSLFPDLASQVLEPYRWKPRFKTYYAGPFGNENVVTRAAIQFPLHSAVMNFRTIAWPTLTQSIIEFHRDRRGRYESFSFYDVQGWDASPDPGIAWNLCFVGIQTSGGVTTFDFPVYHAKQDATRLAYVNGSNVGWASWTRDTGADGRDRIVLSAAPSVGDVVTCSFFGRRVWNAKFATDDLEVVTKAASFYEISVPLIEVP
jgi:hypothetical protein